MLVQRAIKYTSGLLFLLIVRFWDRDNSAGSPNLAKLSGNLQDEEILFFPIVVHLVMSLSTSAWRVRLVANTHSHIEIVLAE
jgi:hypothetical protein